MARRTAFVYGETLSQHMLGEVHPMKPIRLKYTYDLLDELGAFDATEVMVVEPRNAEQHEVLGFHHRAYVEAVQILSQGDHLSDAGEFNLGPGDNPVYTGMYEASMLSTGASLKAAEMLVRGEVQAAFNISGGLHHAMPGYASGFCIFNDPVIAIQYLLNQGMRIAYVDIDCHHGDGVQHAFYDTDKVLTISLHESAEFIFPGTGFTHEIGLERGRGYSVNLPLYPFTTDDLYLWAFREIVPPLVRAFQPDVLVSQMGVDSHFADPITHGALTVQGFGDVVAELNGLAPLWLGLGGGGYDIQAVARAWSVAFGVMSQQNFPERVPTKYKKEHGVSLLTDHKDLRIKDSLRRAAALFAENSVQTVRGLIFPTHNIEVPSSGRHGSA